MKELSDHTRKELFRQCGIKNPKRSPRYNIHHIYFKDDLHCGRIDKHFPINDRSNLIPLPIDVHAELHELIAREPAYRNNMDARVWLANYAFNGELDLI
jgi:hypothetical protein